MWVGKLIVLLHPLLELQNLSLIIEFSMSSWQTTMYSRIGILTCGWGKLHGHILCLLLFSFPLVQVVSSQRLCWWGILQVPLHPYKYITQVSCN